MGAYSSTYETRKVLSLLIFITLSSWKSKAFRHLNPKSQKNLRGSGNVGNLRLLFFMETATWRQNIFKTYIPICQPMNNAPKSLFYEKDLGVSNWWLSSFFRILEFPHSWYILRVFEKKYPFLITESTEVKRNLWILLVVLKVLSLRSRKGWRILEFWTKDPWIFRSRDNLSWR